MLLNSETKGMLTSDPHTSKHHKIKMMYHLMFYSHYVVRTKFYNSLNLRLGVNFPLLDNQIFNFNFFFICNRSLYQKLVLNLSPWVLHIQKMFPFVECLPSPSKTVYLPQHKKYFLCPKISAVFLPCRLALWSRLLPN